MQALGRILFIALVLVVVIFGALFLLLPKSAVKSQNIAIDKPAASVYALLSTAPAGEAIGAGVTQTIVSTTPPSTIVAALTYPDGAKGSATYKVSPTGESASEVSVEVQKKLDGSPFERIGGLTGAPVAALLDSASAHIKTSAAALRHEPITGLVYEVVTLQPQPFLYIEGQVPQDPAAIKEAVAQALVIVQPILTRNGLTPIGRPIAVETQWSNGQYGFQAGIPYQGDPPKILVGVKAGQTPAGHAIKMVAKGPEDQILPTYNKIKALLAAARLQEGAIFEIYNDDPTQAGGSVDREIYFVVGGDISALSKIAPPESPHDPIPFVQAPVLAPTTGPVSETLAPTASMAPAVADTPAPAPAKPAPAATP